MSLLNIANLSLSINGTAILHDVSLRVEPGQIVAVTGESGSGKSMTAFAIMQLLPNGAVSSGRVMLGQTELLTATEAQVFLIGQC